MFRLSPAAYGAVVVAIALFYFGVVVRFHFPAAEVAHVFPIFRTSLTLALASFAYYGASWLICKANGEDLTFFE